MAEMSQPLSILPKKPSHDVLDFAYLKRKGIEQVQKLTGKIWTDFNAHDPGVTILENLCYAITELGYRSRYSVRDILSPKDRPIGPGSESTLFEAHEILPANPLTINDYRKLILDIGGVKNVLIRPSRRYPEFSGIYEIEVVLLPEYDDALNRSIIQQEISLELNMNRNLCEDFEPVRFVEYDDISFRLSLEISGKRDTYDLLNDIYAELIHYISPTAKFYGLQELLDKGMPVDEIFNGPLLKNGFLVDQELERMEIREELYTSDILHFLMDIEGVETVKKVEMVDSQGNAHNWICPVQSGKAPRLDFENTQVRLFSLGKEVQFKGKHQLSLERIIQKEGRVSKHKRLEFVRESGTYRRLRAYYSIQNDFPEAYGIGAAGLPPHVPNSRKAQAKQLKAYLLLFEQLMANYFAQMENLHQIFSLRPIEQTYFTQAIFDLPGAEQLYRPFTEHCRQIGLPPNDGKALRQEWERYKLSEAKAFEQALSRLAENPAVFLDRRNRVLEHLMARFALDPKDFEFFQMLEADSQSLQIQHKTELLSNMVDISKLRGKAFNNIFADLKSESNIAGFELRINKLLGLAATSKTFPRDELAELLQITETQGDEAQADNDSAEGLELLFEAESAQDCVRSLFLHGSNPENFSIAEEEEEPGGFALLLLDDQGQVVARHARRFASPEEAREQGDARSQRLDELARRSEAMHLLERILYRPIDKMRYFGFKIKGFDGQPFFASTRFLTHAERAEALRKVVARGQDKRNYKILPAGVGHKRLSLLDGKEPLLESIAFFSSTEELKQGIDNWVEHFKALDQRQAPASDYVEFFTRQQEAHLLGQDPYSFILTILLPSWVPRFQNKRFLSHLLHLVKRELPAHVWPDFKLADPFEMIELLDLCEQYLSLQRKRKTTVEELEAVSDKLMGLLIA